MARKRRSSSVPCMTATSQLTDPGDGPRAVQRARHFQVITLKVWQGGYEDTLALSVPATVPSDVRT